MALEPLSGNIEMWISVFYLDPLTQVLGGEGQWRAQSTRRIEEATI